MCFVHYAAHFGSVFHRNRRKVRSGHGENRAAGIAAVALASVAVLLVTTPVEASVNPVNQFNWETKISLLMRLAFFKLFRVRT
jgi:hypothetical protein